MRFSLGILMAIVLIAIVRFTPVFAEQTLPQMTIQVNDGNLVIAADDQPVATYVFEDSKIPRPYFAHVKAPGGQQVTRNHPPINGKDLMDHDTLHPGIWMAFGDLVGSDFWRNQAKIVHKSFTRRPETRKGSAAFIEEKQYLRPDHSLVCREEFRCSIHARHGGYLLVWDSTFSSDSEFYFGDQEEMGLGLRVATPLSEVSGGQLTDSEGRKGAPAIWSQSARWCDYSGVVDGQRIGMTLMCHPENFRRSWLHARDYGLVAANLFGRKAMKQGEPSKVIVPPGQSLRLRYAVWIHCGDPAPEWTLEMAYADYLGLSQDEGD
jgi:hypothetical protein